MSDKLIKMATLAAAGILGVGCSGNRDSKNDEVLLSSSLQEIRQEIPLVKVDGKDGIEIQGFSNKIKAVDSSGGLLWQLPTGNGVSALFFYNSGLVLAGLENHLILIDSRNGKILKDLPHLGHNAFISSLSMSEDGIFAADRNNAIVYRFSSHGNLLSLIGGKSPDGIRIPGMYFSVSSAGDGKVWISNPGNHKVEVYSLNGEYMGGFGTAGPEGFIGCCNPISLLALKDGTVITGEKGLLRVRRFDRKGTELNLIAGGHKTALNHLPVFLYFKDGELNISDGLDNLKIKSQEVSL